MKLNVGCDENESNICRMCVAMNKKTESRYNRKKQ